MSITLRGFERVFAAYFLYTSLLAVLLPLSAAIRVRTLVVNLAIAVAYAGFLRLKPDIVREVLRDWLPQSLFLVAYKQMGWFAPASHDHHLEQSWIGLDRALLNEWHGRALTESLGLLLPAVLEFSYLLVYAVPVIAVGILYAYKRRDAVDFVLTTYTIGLFLAYAMFPYFPSEPPRTVFPGELEPSVKTIFRSINQALVGGYGIHTSVFPSAHVSGAFAAAFALSRVFPKNGWIRYGSLIYAILVAVATVYGRYHYAVDALAGFGVACVAALFTLRAMPSSDLPDRLAVQGSSSPPSRPL